MENFFPKKGSKIAVAMSGGVDSAAAAKLLCEMGYDVVGFWIYLKEEQVGNKSFGNTNFASVFKSPANRVNLSIKLAAQGCKRKNAQQNCISFIQAKGHILPEGLNNAVETSEFLHIPFYIVDLRQEFKKWVMDEFVRMYEKGQTPNPCVFCNRSIKFDLAFQWATQALKVDYMATGHYARIARETPNSKLQTPKAKIKSYLLQAKDKSKDQSYFLYAIDKKILDKLVFPLGTFLKEDVKKLAGKWHLPATESKESEDLCFTKDWQKFVKTHAKNIIKTSCKVVDKKGNELGKGKSLIFYTTGQRVGFEMNPKFKNTKTPKYFVVRKEPKNNRLIVGSKKEAIVKEFLLTDLNWLAEPKADMVKVWVKVRSTGKMSKARVKKENRVLEFKSLRVLGEEKNIKQKWKVVLEKSEPGVAPGQAGVMYKKLKVKSEKLKVKEGEWVVIGGGKIYET